VGRRAAPIFLSGRKETCLLKIEHFLQHFALYLVITNLFYRSFFEDPFFVELAGHYALKIAIFDQNQPKILQWIK
jgi:hypothetical protein